MQIHELQPKHKNRTKKRVGRGGRKGTTSGHGSKGQKSRAGRKMVPIIRELIKKYPKLRGYRSFTIDNDFAIVNLDVLEKNTRDGETINPENLVKKGIISQVKGKTPKVKILGTGKITKKIVLERCKTSKTAKEAIEKAGGSIK
ncbi:MAG: 50S ribosomal protein L15 [Candidatus Staskawiczbacteria bacterium]